MSSVVVVSGSVAEKLKLEKLTIFSGRARELVYVFCMRVVVAVGKSQANVDSELRFTLEVREPLRDDYADEPVRDGTAVVAIDTVSCSSRSPARVGRDFGHAETCVRHV